MIHGDGERRSYFYSHLRRPAPVARGDRVWPASGSAPSATPATPARVGCHLHFEIRADGDPIDPAPALRGMVFQRPNPFPKTIFNNVAYGPTLNALVAKRDMPELVERCLRRAALWDEVKDRLDDHATGLSGGQQQRLCIARALGNQPDVLLMDEPCSALDPVATQRVEELIFELKKDYTIVIVTHNMQQAARVSDFTGFFDRGELIEFDETDRIFTSPAKERTEAYITGRFG